MARVCPACGHENADEADFCGSCGGFLRWDPTRATPAVTPEEAAPEPEPEPEHGPEPEPEPIAEPEPVVAPEPVIEAKPAEPEGTPCPACGANIPLDRHFCPSCGTYVTRSAQAVVPQATREPVPEPAPEPEPVPEPAAAVAAGADARRRPPAEPDGTPCPSCGANIPLDRHFCAACGTYPTRSPQVVAPAATPEPDPRTGTGARAGSAEPEPATRARAGARTGAREPTPVAAPEPPPGIPVLTGELRPTLAVGQRSAQLALMVRSSANDTIMVDVHGADARGACRVDVETPSFPASPGRRAGTALTVHALRPRLLGRAVDHTIEIVATPRLPGARAERFEAVFRQTPARTAVGRGAADPARDRDRLPAHAGRRLDSRAAASASRRAGRAGQQDARDRAPPACTGSACRWARYTGCAAAARARAA